MDNRNLIIKITEYALKKQAFKLSELSVSLGLTAKELKFVEEALCSKVAETDNPNHILTVFDKTELTSSRSETGKLVLRFPSNIYQLTPTALYNYIDYLEIIEARKMASEAKKQSELAIKLSVFAIMLGVIASLVTMFFSFWQIYLDHFAK